MSQPLDLIAVIRNWILSDNSDSIIDFFLLTSNMELITRFMSLNLPCISRVIVLNTIDRTNPIFSRMPGKIILTSDYRMPTTKSFFYTFVDFAGSNLIGGSLFSDSIEWNPVFRKNCQKLLLYNYKGPDISRGYFRIVKNEFAFNYMELSKWGKISQNVPIPTMGSIGQNLKIFDEEKAIRWISEMKDFIRSFFDILIDDDEPDKEEYIELFLNEDSMKIWVKGFTHRTVNMIYNNDGMEHKGDRLFVSDFARYLHDRFGRLSSDEATNFQNTYLSRKMQQVFSEDLFLYDRLIKNNLRKTPKSKTDILESFLTCIEDIAKVTPGLNNVMTSKFIYTLCDSLPFDKDISFKTSKNKIKATNEAHGCESEITFVKHAKIESPEFGEGEIIGVLVPQDLLNLYIKIDTANRKNVAGITDNLYAVVQLTRQYFPSREELDDVTESIFDEILKLYNINGLVIQPVVKEDKFFKYLRDTDPEFYQQFEQKLQAEYPKSKITDFGFSEDKLQGYMVLYKFTHQIKDGFSVGERLTTDYTNPLSFLEQKVNLATVPFVNVPNVNGTLTTLQMSKLEAIRYFMSN
jgi:dsRNA-specific ribonuclease